ncbi:MAG TPA: hypothetical protein VNG69_12985 [Casimicrobiaceae bacterium]|nr:hypothetical protein [Casimicrobiaceae bacterium]
MRTQSISKVAATLPNPSCPLLEAGDLPGDDDWSVVESLRFDDADFDDARLGRITLARSFDD